MGSIDYLFASVWRHTESEETEKVEPKARYDDVEHIVGDTSTDVERDCDVGKRSRCDRIHDSMSLDVSGD